VKLNVPTSSVLYLSHGGGPMPLLGDAGHRTLVETLKNISTIIKKPSAIIVISAHWEADQPTITSAATPPLIYDYGGFPPAAYEIQYPAAGHPMLAQDVATLLRAEGFDAKLDATRGFDHGMFVPLKIMYPKADIPCIQLSLLKHLNPSEHIRIGKTLASLNRKNLLIIGSGSSFHNMRAFFTADSRESARKNEVFENWLMQTCSDKNMDEREREKRLIHWQNAPEARYCHPREEHLLPLHVCYGAAGRAASKRFAIDMLGKKASLYLWQSIAIDELSDVTL